MAVAGCGISVGHSAQRLAHGTDFYLLPGPAPCSGELWETLPWPVAPGQGGCPWGFSTGEGSLCPRTEGVADPRVRPRTLEVRLSRLRDLAMEALVDTCGSEIVVPGEYCFGVPR